MGFGDLTSKLRAAAMPVQAIFLYEWRLLRAGWLAWIWLAASAVVTLLSLASTWGQLQTAPLIASLLVPYLVFPWFLFVLLLGISPVTGSRLEMLSDGILSRPITRAEYLLAAWAARLAAVLAVFLVVTLPAVILAATGRRPVLADTVTWFGTTASLLVTGLVLTLQVSLAFLIGTIIRRPLVAALILVALWYPANLVLHTFSLEQFSTVSLAQSLPTLLRTPWKTEDESEVAVGEEDLRAVAEQAERFLSILSGSGGPAPQREQTFFDRGNYEDFSLLRVLLGYGVPSVVAVVLSVLIFYRRDL